MDKKETPYDNGVLCLKPVRLVVGGVIKQFNKGDIIPTPNDAQNPAPSGESTALLSIINSSEPRAKFNFKSKDAFEKAQKELLQGAANSKDAKAKNKVSHYLESAVGRGFNVNKASLAIALKKLFPKGAPKAAQEEADNFLVMYGSEAK